MDFQVVWTDPALADLQQIVAYISRDDPAAAEKAIVCSLRSRQRSRRAPPVAHLVLVRRFRALDRE